MSIRINTYPDFTYFETSLSYNFVIFTYQEKRWLLRFSNGFFTYPFVNNVAFGNALVDKLKEELPEQKEALSRHDFVDLSHLSHVPDDCVLSTRLLNIAMDKKFFLDDEDLSYE